MLTMKKQGKKIKVPTVSHFTTGVSQLTGLEVVKVSSYQAVRQL